MLLYCKKCGMIWLNQFGEYDNVCGICNSKPYLVPKEYTLNGIDFLMTDENREHLREDLVKTSDEFDEKLFNSRDEMILQKQKQFNDSYNTKE